MFIKLNTHLILRNDEEPTNIHEISKTYGWTFILNYIEYKNIFSGYGN